MNDKIRTAVDQITKAAIDQGKIIEVGWLSLRAQAIDPTAPKLQLDEMRMAFFAGAQHLLGSIMSVLEPGEEPTENDLRRLTLIEAELETFITEFKLRIKTEGRA